MWELGRAGRLPFKAFGGIIYRKGNVGRGLVKWILSHRYSGLC